MNPGAAPTLASLRAALGTAFSVSLGDGAAADLTLVEVREDDRYPNWETFSLLFDGPDALLPQGTYAVAHPTTETFGLFLVPIQSAAGSQQYEAVFNRQA